MRSAYMLVLHKVNAVLYSIMPFDYAIPYAIMLFWILLE